MNVLIVFVTDINGATDLIEVLTIDDVPSKWVDFRVLRTERI